MVFKKITFFVGVPGQKALLCVLFFCFCNLTCFIFGIDDNDIKIKNELSESLTVVRIGDIEYQNIAAGSTSDSKSLNGGSYTLSASTESGASYSAEVSFWGRYLDFLVIFRSNGSLEVQKE